MWVKTYVGKATEQCVILQEGGGGEAGGGSAGDQGGAGESPPGQTETRQHSEPTQVILYKQDSYRRAGKGRRCFLGDRIVSMPCYYSYFAPERVEE